MSGENKRGAEDEIAAISLNPDFSSSLSSLSSHVRAVSQLAHRAYFHHVVALLKPLWSNSYNSSSSGRSCVMFLASLQRRRGEKRSERGAREARKNLYNEPKRHRKSRFNELSFRSGEWFSFFAAYEALHLSLNLWHTVGQWHANDGNDKHLSPVL